MVTEQAARRLAEEWIAAWNRRDLDAILAHYTDDIVLTSPLVVKRLGKADGTIAGKERLRDYFGRGLAAAAHLRFELRGVLMTVGGVAILYARENGALVVDALTLAADGRASRAHVYYSSPP